MQIETRTSETVVGDTLAGFGWSRLAATIRAITATLQAGDYNMKLAVALNLPFQAVEEIAFEFRDLPAAEAGHMDVVALRTPLIKVFFPLHVHQIKFVNQTVTLEKFERAVNRDLVDARIKLSRFTQDLTGIEMLLGTLHYAQNGSTLMGHAQAARHQFSLQSSGSFGLRERHGLVENQLQLEN